MPKRTRRKAKVVAAAKPTKPAKPAIIAAPLLPYQPHDPKKYRPGIALIGCGGITAWHLRAYRRAKYNVVAFCDLNRKQAEIRRDEFYPKAFVTDDFKEVLRRDDVEV